MNVCAKFTSDKIDDVISDLPGGSEVGSAERIWFRVHLRKLSLSLSLLCSLSFSLSLSLSLSFRCRCRCRCR